jgi:hypothetical protein
MQAVGHWHAPTGDREPSATVSGPGKPYHCQLAVAPRDHDLLSSLDGAEDSYAADDVADPASSTSILHP